MGGDAVSVPASFTDGEDTPAMKQQIADPLSEIATSWPGGLSGKMEEENDSGESDARSFRDPYRSLKIEENERRMRHVYAQVFKNYNELENRVVNMEVDKSKILSYTPGSWAKNVGGKSMGDSDVPKTTTLLLIGPKGSGKSSLINRISRVLEDDKFAPERAQVTYNSPMGDGTFFLHEYMIPRTSTSFCIYDTRGLSNDLSENLKMVKCWMRKGVRHGKLVKRSSDSSSLKARMKSKARQNKLVSDERRTVNFVIFVVDGLLVLKCVDSNGADMQYTQMVAEVFNAPFLSFKDHKPAIAITHGDLLSLSERARVRVYLGELLGVHPSKQTFDIPADSEPTTDLAIVDMVRYALEHADMNPPCKPPPVTSKGSIIQLWTCLLLLLAVGILITTVHLGGFPSLKVRQKPILQMKNSAESIPLEMKNFMENIRLEVKNFVESISLEMKIFTESVLESRLEMKNFAKSIRLEMKNLAESIRLEMKDFTKSIPEPSLEMKNSAESIPLEMKNMKDFAKSIRQEIKNLAESIPDHSRKIDWKKIRHLWYQ